MDLLSCLAMGGSFLICAALLAGSLAWADDLPMAPDGRGADVPDRHFDLLSLHLDLDLDPQARQVRGSATYRAKRFTAEPLVLDQVGLRFSKVTVGGAEVSYRLSGQTIIIDVPDTVRIGDEAEVTLFYEATPRKGLHFRAPGRSSPDSYSEVWSQGQQRDNRFWFPTFDHPNERFDYTGEVRVPAGWKVHTNSGHKMPAYLVMLAAGQYEVFGEPDNQVWVPPGTSAEAVARVKDKVPQMRQHFEERTGVKYPWGTLRHIYVQRFMYGGMENTAAIINTNTALTDKPVDQTRTRAHALVAHELAHQWYGDLLTCRSWRELWLNEGFASFIAADWMAADRGPDHWAGQVQKWFRSSQDEKALAGRFHQGGGHVNSNVYSKGAAVLQMLRVMLGEAQFWAGIQRYTQTHQHQAVQTIDLQRAMEQVSGQELAWFFQQWVELPHVPRLTVSNKWAEGRLTVTVRQKTGEERPAYTLPVDLEIGTESGVQTRRIWLDDDKIQTELELAKPPTYVAFDPKGGLLVDLENEQEEVAWEAQLSSPSPYAVRMAIEALADTDASDGLAKLLADKTKVPAVRAAAAEALGKQRKQALLLPHLGVGHERVLVGVIRGLGKGADASVVSRLEPLVKSHRNPDVRSAALWAVADHRPDRAAALARGLVGRPTGDSHLTGAAAQVLGRHGEASDLDLLLGSSLRREIRTGGLTAAARIVAREPVGSARTKAGEKVARVLDPLLEDLDYRARSTAVSLLGELGDDQSIAHLERLRRTETDSRLVKKARGALKKIRSRKDEDPAAKPSEAAAKLEDLEERIEALEKELEAFKDKH
jgi:aminopeptidase N